MDKKYIEAKLIKSGNKIEFVASDETLDRQGEVVPIDSWDLKNFRKNPVLLVDHDYRVASIVGSARDLRFEDYGGKLSLVFSPYFHEITQLSKEVKKMVDEGALSTVSVGFITNGPESDGDRPTNELLEISFVSVPANPSAGRIRSMVSDELPEEQVLAIKAFQAGEEKEGRVISGKNRQLINGAIGAMKDAITALDGLISATDEGKSVGDTKNKDNASEQLDKTNKNLGNGQAANKGRAKGGNKRILKALQRLAGDVNGAIYEIKSENSDG